MNLPDSLLEAARDRAREEGRTVTSLVEEALRNLLLDPQSRSRTAVTLPTWEGGRLLVDLDDKEAVWEILDADEPR